jgi:undecaprenyl-diphosphatase
MKDLIRYNLIRFVRFLRKHVSRDNRDLPYYILIFGAFIIAVVGLNLFVELTDELGEGGLKIYDNRIFEYVWSFRPDFDGFFLFITDFGGFWAYVVATVIVTAFLFWKFRHWEFVIQLLLVIIIAGLSNQFLKEVFQRARPSIENMLIAVETLSYPSGHAMCAMSYYGFLAYLIFHIKMRKRVRATVFVLLVFLIAAIGISRVYLGAHYASDVVAGYIAGLIWLMFCIVLFTVISIYRRRKARRDPAEREENLE